MAESIAEITGADRRNAAHGGTLVVTRKRAVAEDVVELTLARPDGTRLPDWAPGAHIDVVLPDGTTRQYSLVGDRWDAHSFTIAVLREPDGRGGSAYVHDELREGDHGRLRRSAQQLPLVARRGYLFVAGGIGITPILPMIRAGGAARRPLAPALPRPLPRARWRISTNSTPYGDRRHDPAPPTSAGSRRDRRVDADRRRPAARLRVRTGAHCSTRSTTWRRRSAGHRCADRALHRAAPTQGRPCDAVRGRGRHAPARSSPSSRRRVDHRRAAPCGVDVLTSCAQGVCGTCETGVLAACPTTATPSSTTPSARRQTACSPASRGRCSDRSSSTSDTHGRNSHDATTTAADAPHSDIDPFDLEFLDDPLPFHATLRDAGPVVLPGRSTTCTRWRRYAEVHAALVDWQSFQSAAGVGLSNFRTEKPWRPPSLLLEADPPHHDAPRAVARTAADHAPPARTRGSVASGCRDPRRRAARTRRRVRRRHRPRRGLPAPGLPRRGRHRHRGPREPAAVRRLRLQRLRSRERPRPSALRRTCRRSPRGSAEQCCARTSPTTASGRRSGPPPIAARSPTSRRRSSCARCSPPASTRP